MPLTPTTDIGFVSATPLASTPAAGACAVANPGTGQDCQMSSLLPGESASWDLVIIARPIGNAPQFTIGGATVLSTSSTPSRDSNPNNNTTSYTDAQGNQFINQPINVQAGADLLLDVNTVNLGGNRFRFDLTLTNNGPSQAENVKLEGFLPAQLDNPSPKLAGSDCQAAPHGSALAPNGQAFIRCTFNKSLGGPMAPNTSLLWYVDVAGVAGSSGPVDFSLSFTSTTADPNPGNNVNISRRVNLGGGGFTQTGGGALNVWTLAVLMLGLFSATIWSSRQ
ncbi:MAG: hypothetical protein D6698_04425 [Gammaproteobacteria bacterium]|nr:MAG: hypothetical protein D6698_04425 [Gammaproteobacteria bacterium]